METKKMQTREIEKQTHHHVNHIVFLSFSAASFACFKSSSEDSMLRAS